MVGKENSICFGTSGGEDGDKAHVVGVVVGVVCVVGEEVGVFFFFFAGH